MFDSPLPARVMLRTVIVFIIVSVGVATGCERSDEDGIRVYDAPKDPPVVHPQVDWKLPGGWQEVNDVSGSQFGRVATIQPDKRDPFFLLTVNQIQSGDLASNLNRWEKMLELRETPAEEAAKKATDVQVAGHAGHRVDLTGVDAGAKNKPAARLLGVIVPLGDREAWTFKLQGSPDKVAAQAKAFEEFLATVKFAGHDHPEQPAVAPTGAVAPPAPTPSPTPSAAADQKHYALKGFATPSGWVNDPTPRTMRTATFFVGTGNERAEVIVTRLRAGAFGSDVANLNRWRKDAGLPEIADASQQPSSKLKVDGDAAEATVYDFAGPGDEATAKRSFVASLVKGADNWFVKMLGPARTVGPQRANFEQFVQSMQFGETSE
jgi:hypothetical protein